MSDLIERLREGVHGKGVALTDDILQARLHEAAAEIERLKLINFDHELNFSAAKSEIARLRDGIYRAAEGLEGGADIKVITKLLDVLLEQSHD